MCLSYKLWVTSFSASKMFVSRIEDCFSVLGDFIFIGVRIRAYDLFTIILPGSGRGEREKLWVASFSAFTMFISVTIVSITEDSSL